LFKDRDTKAEETPPNIKPVNKEIKREKPLTTITIVTTIEETKKL